MQLKKLIKNKKMKIVFKILITIICYLLIFVSLSLIAIIILFLEMNVSNLYSYCLIPLFLILLICCRYIVKISK